MDRRPTKRHVEPAGIPGICIQFKRRIDGMNYERPSVYLRFLGAFMLACGMAMLIGCGSTKVYTADKTMIYRGELYNVSNVQKISGRKQAQPSDGETVNLGRMDKKELEFFFKNNPGAMVSMIVDMDQQEMTYLRMGVDSYRDYAQLEKRFDKAMGDIAKFMADRKNTQLQLK